MSDPAKNVRFAEQMKAMQKKFVPDQVTTMNERPRGQELTDVAPRTPGVMDEQFPTDEFVMDTPKDKVMMAKLALQDDPVRHPGMTKFGKLIAKDSDFEWEQRKQAALEKADFDAWFAQHFDLMSPAQKKVAKNIYPQFYAARKKLLKKQSKNAFDMARIKLEGIESMEDLKKTYMAETGRLDLGPMQRLMQPESGFNEYQNQQRFQRGLANPFLVFGKEAAPTSARETGLEIRNRESGMYAQRLRDAAVQNRTTKLGLTTGVLPLGAGAVKDGDKQWYQVLKA